MALKMKYKAQKNKGVVFEHSTMMNISARERFNLLPTAAETLQL